MTTSDTNQQLAAVLTSITVESPEHFTIGGQPVAVRASSSNSSAPGPTQAFLRTLAARLYELAYSRPFRSSVTEAGPVDYSPNAELIDRLSGANATKERWERGWSIEQLLSHGQVSVSKLGRRRTVWPGQFISDDGPASIPRVGARVSLFYARESRTLQPAFYYAFGEGIEEDGLGFGLVRCYWNITVAGAPILVHALTSRLNLFDVPFRFKCATSLSQFDRTDVAVLYVGKRYFGIVSEILADVLPQLRAEMGPEVPLFAKALAPGLGVAEDPGNGESFGQHRCRPLAESVWNCFERGQQALTPRLAEFRRLVEAAGLDPDRLHLNAGSHDWYSLPGAAQ
jgi:HopA1 effector protein family